jgi:Predicted oxidoreductases (related to aryl-alcohol dehydrogenases)
MISKRLMGRTGLKLSELCLGTLNFGWKTDETTAHAILDAYHAAGGAFIQSTSFSREPILPSAAFCWSEEFVGRWWTLRGIPRRELTLATRVHVRQPEKGAGNFAEIVRETLEDSMRRLRTSYLDLVIFEWNDGLVPVDATLEAFDLVIRSGVARFIGAANFPAWRVADTLGRAYHGVHNRMEALQADYSLMTRARLESETMALCREHRLGFLASSPLAGGFLARERALESMLHTVRRERLMARFGNAYGRLAHSTVADVAARHEASTAQIALAWVLHNPTVTSALVGVHSVAQMNDLVRATSIVLSDEDLERLDQATAIEEIRLPAEPPRARSADLVLS